MIDPSALVDAVVAKLRAIPALAARMNGQGGASIPNIDPYHDAFPVASSIQNALRKIPKPGILIYYAGQEPQGENERYGHRIRAVIRMGIFGTEDNPPAAGYSELIKLMVDGIPTDGAADGLSMRLTNVFDDCDPMDAPTWQRLTDTDGLDYFEMDCVFVERTGL